MGLFSKDKGPKKVKTVPFHFAYFVERDGKQVAEDMALDVDVWNTAIGRADIRFLTFEGIEACREDIARLANGKIVIISATLLMPADFQNTEMTEAVDEAAP